MVSEAPDSVPYRERLATITRGLGQCEQAFEHLKWLTEQRPNHLDYWSQYGLCAKKLGKHAQARKAGKVVGRLLRGGRRRR